MLACEQNDVDSLTVDRPLSRCRIGVGHVARARAAAYLRNVILAESRDGRFPAVCIHYEQRTTGVRNGLAHATVENLCHTILARGYVPIVLDWESCNPLPDQRTIFAPRVYDGDLWGNAAPGDPEMLAALIGQSTLMVGADGGPLRVAGATDTPTVGIWTDSHPVAKFAASPNVLHLVPVDHARQLSSAEDQQRFYEQYAHRTYNDLDEELPGIVAEHLVAGARRDALLGLTTERFDASYYDEHKTSGLDYLIYIDWQRNYGQWLTGALNWKGRRVLDVGCACGAIVRGFVEAGANMQGVDVNEHMIRAGRHEWAELDKQLFICDAVNLHLFSDMTFDGLHSTQVAEHWKPELVPFVLRELRRVTRPGGLFFCCLDTAELFARQGRDAAREDPTHVCIRPLAWWKSRLDEAGWNDVTTAYAAALRDHPHSFLGNYDWDWFVAKRD